MIPQNKEQGIVPSTSQMNGISGLRKQMDAVADWAKSVGMTEDDITDAKKTVRKRKTVEINNKNY